MYRSVGGSLDPKIEYFHRHLKTIEESQWFSNRELDTLQFERTKTFLIYVQRHSRFYRKLFAEYGFKEDIARTALNLGNASIKINAFDSALHYYKQALELYKHLDNPYGKALTYQ